MPTFVGVGNLGWGVVATKGEEQFGVDRGLWSEEVEVMAAAKVGRARV